MKEYEKKIKCLEGTGLLALQFYIGDHYQRS